SRTPVKQKGAAKTTRRLDSQSQRSGLLVGSIPAAVLALEPAVGIEPTTARLRIECSTTELRWRSFPLTIVVHALARTRTVTPCGTTPSRWRVYQFHHQGPATYNLRRSAIRESEFQFQTSLLAVRHGSDGART